MFFAWYDNGTGFFEFAGEYEAESAKAAAKAAWEDGCRWTVIRVTRSTDPAARVLAWFPVAPVGERGG